MEKPLCTLPDGSCLIETFGWTPNGGAERHALHLARLKRSAKELGVAYDHAEVDRRVAAIQSDSRLRCRLTVSAKGEVDLTTAPMPAAPSGWKVAISPERLNSDDPLLSHKTSQRALYDRARADMPKGVDEVIFLNERQELCEGTITNILVKLDGAWITPPVSCGCLPGVYRQSLLDAGKLREAVLTLSDLDRAQEIRLCNSLRGEITAALVT